MRTRAVILKKQNTNENDQMITAYTEEFGKLTAVAKSVLKNSSIQAMHLDVFNLVDFELITGKSMPIIAGAQAERVYPGLKSSLPAVSAAYFFAEAVDKITFEQQKDENLWAFMLSVVEGLDGGRRDDREFIREKQVELLEILGYTPNLAECIFCGSPGSTGPVAYNIEVRGMVCGQCFLGGQRGIVLKNRNFLSAAIINGIFESIAERRIHSLSLVNTMVK